MVIQKQLFFNYYFLIFNYFNKQKHKIIIVKKFKFSNKKVIKNSKKGVEKIVRKLQNRTVF